MSAAMLTAALVLTVTAVAGCVLLWDRLPAHPATRLAVRIGLILSCQVCAVSLAGLILNDHFGFYSSWSEVLGRPAVRAATAAPITGSLDQRLAGRLRAAYQAGHGTVVPIVIRGTVSGVPPQRAWVYLPAAYSDPAAASMQFPVVELLHGFPGRPQGWTGPLKMQRVLDDRIMTRQSLPMIAVMPTQNLDPPRDTQCLDVAGGPKVDTFLTQDVHRAVAAAFRVIPDRSGWAVMGYSTGGYCALNLAMRHPNLFASAVSLSGDAQPAHSGATGGLFGGSIALRNANTPLWREQHLPAPDLSVLVMTSRADRGSS
ncbi:MAG: alpha/beta hydrolase, partial [Frankia sp.]